MPKDLKNLKIFLPQSTLRCIGKEPVSFAALQIDCILLTSSLFLHCHESLLLFTRPAPVRIAFPRLIVMLFGLGLYIVTWWLNLTRDKHLTWLLCKASWKNILDSYVSIQEMDVLCPASLAPNTLRGHGKYDFYYNRQPTTGISREGIHRKDNIDRLTCGRPALDATFKWGPVHYSGEFQKIAWFSCFFVGGWYKYSAT